VNNVCQVLVKSYWIPIGIPAISHDNNVTNKPLDHKLFIVTFAECYLSEVIFTQSAEVNRIQ